VVVARLPEKKRIAGGKDSRGVGHILWVGWGPRLDRVGFVAYVNHIGGVDFADGFRRLEITRAFIEGNHACRFAMKLMGTLALSGGVVSIAWMSQLGTVRFWVTNQVFTNNFFLSPRQAPG